MVTSSLLSGSASIAIHNKVRFKRNALISVGRWFNHHIQSVRPLSCKLRNNLLASRSLSNVVIIDCGVAVPVTISLACVITFSTTLLDSLSLSAT